MNTQTHDFFCPREIESVLQGYLTVIQLFYIYPQVSMNKALNFEVTSAHFTTVGCLIWMKTIQLTSETYVI